MSEPESSDGQQRDPDSETFEEKEERKEQEDRDLELVAEENTQEPTDAEVEAIARRVGGTVPATESTTEPETVAEPELTTEPIAEPKPDNWVSEGPKEEEERQEAELDIQITDADDAINHEVAEQEIAIEKADVVAEPAAEPETETDGNSHLFAVRTTGGQEKIVMRLLEARIKMGKINIQSVVLLSDLKGYVVVEAQDVSAMFDAIQGIRHVRGQLRGELTYNEIDKYLIKKSTVSELAVEKTVEIIGGPFKGMKATITRVDKEKEEATVILLDATYQLPVTVDANYLKLVPT